MKKIGLLVLLLSCLFAFTGLAQAKEFPWQGAQIQTVVGGEATILSEDLKLDDPSAPVVKKPVLAWRGSAHLLWIPESGTAMIFTYTGPKWYATDWLWISPQGGYAGAFAPDGKDMGLVSLWLNFTMLDGLLTLFLEGDGYFNKTDKNYYGYYALDYNPLEYLNVGVHGEQVDKGVMFGPHVGFTKGPWHVGIEYYLGFQDINRGHNVRFVNSLYF